MKAEDIYEDVVRCKRKVSVIAGPGEETITLAEMRKDGGILAAFADDNDIQQITVYSSNIGMVRQYTKTYRRRDKNDN